ncbi:MAG TPA: hypothetical protein VFQ22_05715 [Longimicrobiales bacterium]|nr:hypothetical protein [Longimicrobiales bacterium]
MSRYHRAPATRAGLCLLSLGLVAGCASGGTGGGAGGDPDLITRDEIMQQPQGTAFTVIQRLRPRWLRPRTQGTLGNPQPAYAEVFVDSQHFGPIDSLGQIAISDIESIEFIDATNATTRYGTGYVGGIIRVNTMRGG